MDKKTFDLLMEFQSLENDLYFKLDKEMGMEKSEELVGRFTDLIEKTLKIEKYLDVNMYVGKDTFLNKSYEDLDRYLKVHVIYEYDNEWVLCSTTTDLICFVPKSCLKEYE